MIKKEEVGKTNIKPQREGRILVFLFILIGIFLFLIISVLFIIFSRIKIEIENFKYSSNTNMINKKHTNDDYYIILKLCILKNFPIIKIKITDEKINKFKSNVKLKEKIKKEFGKIDIKKLEKEINITKLKKISKTIKILIERFSLKVELGTENAVLTAMIIPFISTLISFLLRNKMETYKKQKYNIKPIFINKNLLNIEFSGIFQIKMIHIINIIYILNKKEGDDRNERTSNRRSYAYSYE